MDEARELEARRTLDGWRRLALLLESHDPRARRQGAAQLAQSVVETLVKLGGPLADGQAKSGLWELLRETCRLCVASREWDTRVAAGHALGKILSGIVELDDQQALQFASSLQSQCQVLSLQSVDVGALLKRAAPLVARRDKGLRVAKAPAELDLARERAETLKNLRLSTFRSRHSRAATGACDESELVEDAHANVISSHDHSGIIDESDIRGVAGVQNGDGSATDAARCGDEYVARKRKGPSEGAASRLAIRDLLKGPLEAAPRNETPRAAKRARAVKGSSAPQSARERAQEQVHTKQSESTQAMEESDLDALLRSGAEAGQDAWLASLAGIAARVWFVLSQHLLSDRWEARHGASAALMVVASRAAHSPGTIQQVLGPAFEDVVVKSLCVLGMDRFGDYANDSVVAPVRESCAQLLSAASASSPSVAAAVLGHLLDLLLDVPTVAELSGGDDLSTATWWGRRFAALLAIKYLVCRQPDGPLARRALPAVLRVLLDEAQANVRAQKDTLVDTPVYNDDVRRGAAEAMLAACALRFPEAASQVDVSVVRRVWSCALGSLDAREEKAQLEVAVANLWALLARLDDATMSSGAAVAQLGALSSFIWAPPETAFSALSSKLAHPSSQVRFAAAQAVALLLDQASRTRSLDAPGLPNLSADAIRSGNEPDLEGVFPSRGPRLDAWLQVLAAALLRESSARAASRASNPGSQLAQETERHYEQTQKSWALFVRLFAPQCRTGLRGVAEACIAHWAAHWTRAKCDIGALESGRGAAFDLDKGVADARRAAAAFALSSLLAADCAAGGQAFAGTHFGDLLAHYATNDQGTFLLLGESLCLALAAARAAPCALRVLALLAPALEVQHDDWGSRSAIEVLNARAALELACKFLCETVAQAGLPEEAFTEHGEQVLSLRQGRKQGNAVLAACSNAELCGAARLLASDALADWISRLAEPDSRQAALRWNETATGARQNVLDRVSDLEAAAARASVQQSALASAARVLLVAPGDQLQGQVTPLVRPLLKPFLVDFDPALDEGLLALLGQACARLLELLAVGGESRAKALNKLGAKLIQSKARRASLVAVRVVAERSGTFSRLVALLPALADQLERWVANPAGTPGIGRLLDVLSTAVGAGLVKPSAESLETFLPLLDALLGWITGAPEQLEGAKGQVGEFLLACARTPALNLGVWLRVLDDLLPWAFSARDSTLEAARVASIGLLHGLLADSSVCLPWVVALALPLVRGMQDPDSEAVRQAAGACLSRVVELLPIHDQAGPPSTDGYGTGACHAATDARDRGVAFVQGLLAGASGLAEDEARAPLALATASGIELRPYQKQGVAWLEFLALHGLGGALCDDLGLGKTLMSLTQLAAAKTPHRVSAVVCPSSLTGHWAQEIETWYGAVLEAVEYVGPPPKRQAALANSLERTASGTRHLVVVVSYAVLGRDAGRLAAALDLRYCILDEAHTIRNPHSAVAAACKVLGAKAAHRLALTGTPVHNDVTDLWSVFDFLMPGYLGDLETFEATMAKPIRASRSDFKAAMEAAAVDAAGELGAEPALEADGARDDASLDTAGGAENGAPARPGLVSGGGRDSRAAVAGSAGAESAPGRAQAKPPSQAAAKQLAQARAQEALEALHRRVLPFILRRTKAAVLRDLPPKIVQDVVVELTPQQQALYAHLLENVKASVSGATPRNALGDLARLMMACTHPLLCLRNLMPHVKKRLERRVMDKKISAVKDLGARASCKFQAVEDLLVNHVLLQRSMGAADSRLEGFSRAAAGSGGRSCASRFGGAAGAATAGGPGTRHKAIVFAQWKGTLDLLEEQVLRQSLAGKLRYLRLDGSTKPHERQGVVNRFNEDEGIGLLLATTKVGGQGLNLTSADLVVFLESSWNPQEDLQAMDRAHRIGQKRCVYVQRIITRGTIEDKLLSLQMFKLHVASKVVDAANSSLATMQTDRVMDVLSQVAAEAPGRRGLGADGQPGGEHIAGSADLAGAEPGLKPLASDLDAMYDSEQYADFDVERFAQCVSLPP